MSEYKVLSPWAQVDYSGACALNPRLDTLEGKKIGMFSHFKGHSPFILREVAAELSQRYSDMEFSYFQYPRDTREIENDPDFRPQFEEWLAGVDAVIAAYGDAGSCAMYHAYNTSMVEKLGKPAVLMVKADIITSATRGAAARFVPALRMVKVNPALPDLSFARHIDANVINDIIKPNVHDAIDAIVEGLTAPLTQQEQELPQSIANKYADEALQGNLQEINDRFYSMGWSAGLPVIPPTQEAVSEMLRGTDLPPDHVVAKLPPMLGKATVEKIAVNAVMAGCLPVYMPFLIAAVKAMDDPRIHLVGWTCSVAGFAANMCVAGPGGKDIALNATKAVLSPYYRPNACIARALSYIIMNISGSRPGLEDNAYMGHEGRFFSVFREDEEASPWDPVQVDYGFAAQDTTVTLFWSHERAMFKGGGKPETLLANMCAFDNPGGFDPGCTFIMTAGAAKLLADEGMSRADAKRYIWEYARKPSSTINARWMKDNNHMPTSDVPLPLPGDYTARKYFTDEHINIFVAGHSEVDRGIAMPGGGDHGGPATAKVELPAAWGELVSEYAAKIAAPNYINY